MKNKYYIIPLSVTVLLVAYYLRQTKKYDQAEVQKLMTQSAQSLGLKATKTDKTDKIVKPEEIVQEMLPKSDYQYVRFC